VKTLAIAAGAVVLAAGGFAFSALSSSQDTVGTQTFTNVVSYTIPTVTETVYVTTAVPPPVPPPPPPSSCVGTELSPPDLINPAIATAVDGGTLCLHAGTYNQDILYSRPIHLTIKAAGDGPVNLRPASTSGDTYPVQVTGSNLTLGPGLDISGSDGVSSANVFLFGGANHDVVVGNRIHDGQDQGVFADNTTSFLSVLRNEIDHSGTGHVSGQHQSHGVYIEGRDQIVANNLLHDFPFGFGVQAYPTVQRITIAGNTIVAAAHSAIVVGGGTGYVIRNNVCAFNASWCVERAGCPSASFVDHNVNWSNPGGVVQTGCNGISVAGGNRTADPLFVDFPGRDLHVLTGSPAIDYGAVSASFTPAFDGVTRPVGLGPDSQAYER
jgi:hypothetical protein